MNITMEVEGADKEVGPGKHGKRILMISLKNRVLPWIVDKWSK